MWLSGRICTDLFQLWLGLPPGHYCCPVRYKYSKTTLVVGHAPL